MNCQGIRPLLDAYADGELDAAGDLKIESHLHACVECARALEEHRVLAAALRSSALRFDAPGDLRESILKSLSVEFASGDAESLRPVPIQLPSPVISRRWWAFASSSDTSVNHPHGPGRPIFARLLPFAAAAVIFLLGTLVGSLGLQWHSHSSSAGDLLTQEIVSSHVRSLLAEGHLADVLSSDRHTVKPWFEGKLDYSPPVSDLATQGFPLVGGRLDYLNGRPVASLLYRRDKHVINVFVWPSSPPDMDGSENQETTRQGYHLLHWTGAGMNWWAVSNLNETELTQFSKLLQAATAK